LETRFWGKVSFSSDFGFGVVNKARTGKAPNLLRERELNEFGVFKVTKRVGNETEIYFTGTRKKSVAFLKGLKNY